MPYLRVSCPGAGFCCLHRPPFAYTAGMRNPPHAQYSMLPTPEHEAQSETNGAVLVVMDETGKVTETVTKETLMNEKKEVPPLPASASLFGPESESAAQAASSDAPGMSLAEFCKAGWCSGMQQWY